MYSTPGRGVRGDCQLSHSCFPSPTADTITGDAVWRGHCKRCKRTETFSHTHAVLIRGPEPRLAPATVEDSSCVKMGSIPPPCPFSCQSVPLPAAFFPLCWLWSPVSKVSTYQAGDQSNHPSLIMQNLRFCVGLVFHEL